MRVVDFLRNLRDGSPISREDVILFIEGVTNETIPDYQISAFLMAAYLRGIDSEQTIALTLAMRDSGKLVDLSDCPGIKVDKHSTGGVGDKISIALAPLVAACGVPVPMVSGRGLGHTGGTLDKLQSIPGFNINLSLEKFRQQVKTLGVAMIGQTDDMAPADRKLYALRDATATVESIPLITASILSKKLAEGIQALVLDVKVGCGAFMRSLANAKALAKTLLTVGQGAGLQMRALLTRMDEPLGRTIGNALEVREAIAILKNQGPQDTTELTVELGAEMLVLGQKVHNIDTARSMLLKAITTGQGLEKLRQMIEAQGGDPRVIDQSDLLPQARFQTPVTSQENGYVGAIDSFALGMATMRLGAGRAKAADVIDSSVGLELLTRPGTAIQPKQTLAIVHHNTPLDGGMLTSFQKAFSIAHKPPMTQPLVIERF